MDLRQLATFRMVAHTLNFTQAAAALDYAQSSVTAQIQALEADLGVSLFDRLGKRVMLTEAGERLLRYADQLLSLTEEARSAVVSEEAPAGTLTIGAAETLLIYRLPAVLQAFRRRYPGVRLVLRPFRPAAIRQEVMEGGLDVAFVLEEPVRAQGVVVEPLVVEPVALIAPPDHRLAEQEMVRPEDLAGESILFTELGCSYRNQFEHALIGAGVYPSATLEFNSVEAIKQCVRSGLGVAVLPAVAVEKEVVQGQLAVLRWGGPRLEVVTQMLWHRERGRQPALRAFLEVTREVMQAAGPAYNDSAYVPN